MSHFRSLVSIVLAVAWGSSLMLGLGTVIVVLGNLALLLPYWLASPWIGPIIAARVALPGGGEAWIQQGRGVGATARLYVARPGRRTAYWGLGPVVEAQPAALAVDARRGELRVLRGDAEAAWLAWGNDAFAVPGERWRRGGDGEIGWLGRPEAPEGRGRVAVVYWRASAAEVARLMREGPAALGGRPLDLELFPPTPADVVDAVAAIGLDDRAEALAGGEERPRLPDFKDFRGSEVWRFRAADLASHVVAVDYGTTR